MNNQTLISIRSMICILANRLIYTEGYTRQESFKAAWAVVRKAEKPCVVEAYFKSTGCCERRVADRNWFLYAEPKGGKSHNTDSFLFADLAKVATGKPAIRCAKLDNVKALSYAA